MFVLSEKAYEFLKNLVQIIFPALGSLYFSLAGIWGLPGGDKVVGTLAVLATFGGVILKISSRTYEALGKAYDGEMLVSIDEDGSMTPRLSMNEDWDVLAGKESISFRRVVEEDKRSDVTAPEGDAA